ncbi:hypothetical protein [Streptomyces sp. NBC_00439]|uniref:hypothetical protein n=1 Tax=Streptomyces sp. NBC_00439 TaxID=2903650 RepID=UPI00224FC398|nr:hypothetical protein [Streptomyces sp. NBC_00439]MCX5106954.1 hypothetical protein [Streptomyces sp. NBC_00439]
MLNGTAMQYRTRPVLTGHPASRPCPDPSCHCPVQTSDKGHSARSGRPADRYESWMISARHYRLVPHPGTGAPVGISLNAPILRRRVLREAALPPDHASLLALLRTALDLEP